MSIYKQPGSPYYYYDFYFEKRRYQASTHLRNKTVAHRVECIKKAKLAQRHAGIHQEWGFPEYSLGYAQNRLSLEALDFHNNGPSEVVLEGNR